MKSTIRRNTASEEWIRLLYDLTQPQQTREVHPRGMKTSEILGRKSYIDMTSPVVINKERKLGKKFLPGEAWWILSGKDDVESIARYNKNITKFSDDGETFFGAYGPKIKDQLDYVIDALDEDINTRQAVINIWRENPKETKDYPCTLNMQFIVRNQTMYTMVNMRSGDAWLGWPYDVFNFSMISLYVSLCLNKCGAHMFSDKGYLVKNLGFLTLNVGSQHLYEKDLGRAEDVLRAYERRFKKPVEIKEPFIDLGTYRFINSSQLVDDLKNHADNKEKHKSWLSPFYKNENK